MCHASVTSDCGSGTGSDHQHRIHEAEDRGIGADAEREGEDREDTEHFVRRQHAHAVAQVLPELFEQCPAPCRARVFTDDRQITQVQASRTTRLVDRHTVDPAILGFLVEMKLQFFLKIGFFPIASQEPHQLAQERGHGVSTPPD